VLSPEVMTGVGLPRLSSVPDGKAEPGRFEEAAGRGILSGIGDRSQHFVQPDPRPRRNDRYTCMSQDGWKVTPDVHVKHGLGWEHERTSQLRYGEASVFARSTASE